MATHKSEVTPAFTIGARESWLVAAFASVRAHFKVAGHKVADAVQLSTATLARRNTEVIGPELAKGERKVTTYLPYILYRPAATVGGPEWQVMVNAYESDTDKVLLSLARIAAEISRGPHPESGKAQHDEQFTEIAKTVGLDGAPSKRGAGTESKDGVFTPNRSHADASTIAATPEGNALRLLFAQYVAQAGPYPHHKLDIRQATAAAGGVKVRRNPVAKLAIMDGETVLVAVNLSIQAAVAAWPRFARKGLSLVAVKPAESASKATLDTYTLMVKALEEVKAPRPVPVAA